MSSVYTFFHRRLCWLSLIGISMMLLAQLLGRTIWQLELITHYVPHLTLLLLFTFVFYSIDNSDTNPIKNHASKHVYLPLVMLNFATGICVVFCLMPWHVLLNQNHKATHSSALTIAYQNVNINNSTRAKAIAELSVNNPDILVLVEAGGTNWQSELSQLANRYATHCGMNENSPFAMQVYAKDMQARCEILTVQGVALAKLTLQDGRLVYAAHPPPPISGHMAQARNSYLKALAELIKTDAQQDVIVVGDFNLSAFSPIYRDFIKDSGTDNKHLQRTTLTGLPTWLPLGIGIDHVLTTADIQNIHTKAQGWSGSDHRGFWIEWQ